MRFVKLDAGTRRRLFIGMLIVAVLVSLVSAVRYLRPQTPRSNPALGLMTTLPLQWSEGGIEADLASDAQPHPVYTRLQRQYDVRPIDRIDQLKASNISLLILAQPRALWPAELVALDEWVRGGGRVMVLADPALQWGSLYPFGDKRRPLFTSLLSPLFSHWGLELVLPMTDELEIAVRSVDAHTIRTQTPGEWLATGSGKGAKCRIATHKLLADCRVGQGRALLVADADLLDAVYWEGQGVRAVTGNDEFGNLLWVESLLKTLRNRQGNPGDFVGK